jgi:hypothetical protein
MKREAVAAAGLALLLLAGCGRGEQRSDQPTAEENEKLDGIAGKVEQEQDGTTTFDTSPDSQIPVEAPSGGNNQAAAPANGVAPVNSAQPAVSANAAAPN